MLDFNAAACRIYGYEASEAVGSHIMDIMVPPDKREQTQDLLRAMRQKRRAPIRIELMQSSALRRSGEVFPIEVSISSVRNREGTVMVAFVRDISERLAEQAELIETRDRAVAGEQAKARMLAVMSHEMRTPLNGVLGTLDLLRTTALDDTQRHYVEVMEQSGRMLLSHVNDVLDISRADSGHIELAEVAFDPGQVASDVLDGLKAEAERRG
ncbi:MAG: histidine kinase dimerization/phospho-acceptor domain-containing protein, partial [Pararhodobacter sp.]